MKEHICEECGCEFKGHYEYEFICPDCVNEIDFDDFDDEPDEDLMSDSECNGAAADEFELNFGVGG